MKFSPWLHGPVAFLFAVITSACGAPPSDTDASSSSSGAGGSASSSSGSGGAGGAPAECAAPPDCADHTRPAGCPGTEWACTAGTCEPVCNCQLDEAALFGAGQFEGKWVTDTQGRKRLVVRDVDNDIT